MPTLAFADFADVTLPRPDGQALLAELGALLEQFDAALDGDAAVAVLREWDALRGRVRNWQSFVSLRYRQDTADAHAIAEREAADALAPALAEGDAAIQRAALVSPHRDAIAQAFGEQALALWGCQARSNARELLDDQVAELELQARYTSLIGGARVPFDGATHTLAALGRFVHHPDRARRHAAESARWHWFAEHDQDIEDIFGELVTLRTRMGRRLGHETFVPLAYERMKRIDYGRPDVERFRESVAEHVTPLASRLAERQAARLGVDKLMHWDTALHEPEGPPALVGAGDVDTLRVHAGHMFAALHPELSDFWQLMDRHGLMDLAARTGKGPGGFCTFLPDHGVPFIFANANGTRGDVRVFTHEMGHAFQRHMSRALEPIDLTGCTMESAEVHSMSLEFLCWPEMERFFGDDADSFRASHLAEQIAFLPYGCLVDHFQHEVYEHPDMDAADRKATWQRLERSYMPWRDFGDLAHPAGGGFWHTQLHLFTYPFYYIDYVLAETCALQFRARAERDRPAAWDAYVQLCARGGTLPFRELVASAGLDDPFAPATLPRVVAESAAWLGL